MTSENYPVELPKEEGSYLSGLAGALLGALIGAVLWCLVMQLGIIASIVGFAIGWLAEKGYTLLKGKVGTGKVVILVIAVIVGVVVGIFAAHYIDWYQTIAEFAPDAAAWIDGRQVPVTYSDIPRLIIYYLSTDAEYLGGTIKDVVLGLVFAFAGVFSILRTAKQQADNKQQAAQPPQEPQF